MRLSQPQIESIRNAVRKVLGPEGVVIRLFGSRADDDLRGGDIDLLVETDQVVENRAQAICAIQGALFRSLGDRKVDILLKDSRTPDAAVFRIAKEKGATL